MAPKKAATPTDQDEVKATCYQCKTRWSAKPGAPYLTVMHEEGWRIREIRRELPHTVRHSMSGHAGDIPTYLLVFVCGACATDDERDDEYGQQREEAV